MPVIGQISVGDGATFTPSVSSAGVISWTNNKNLPNPASVDLGKAVVEAIWFDDMASLRSADLAVGKVAGTKGYYAANDGGNGYYIIRADNSDTDDGGSIIVLDNGNVAELITDGTANVKQFGAKGDGVTDDTTAIINAIAFADTIIINKGTFAFGSNIQVPDNKTMFGYGGDSILLYTGTERAITLTGCFCSFRHFVLKADTTVDSANKVGFTMNRLHGSPKTIQEVIIEGMEINYFDFAGIDLHTVWNISVRTTKIRGNVPQRTTPVAYYGIYFDRNSSSPTWSSSGCVFRDLYIYYCSYGIYMQGCHGQKIEQCIFEYNYSPMYSDQYGLQFVVDQCWFEANTTGIVTRKNPLVIGGRNISVVKVDGDSYYTGYNTVSGSGITVRNKYSTITDQITNGTSETIISGNSPTTRDSNGVKGIALQNWSGYYDAVYRGLEKYFTAELALQAIGNSNKKSWGELVFSAGYADGANTANSTAPVPVLKVDRYGTITPENSANHNADVGSSTNMYNVGYFKSIVLKGADNNLYTISVDGNGNLTATIVS